MRSEPKIYEKGLVSVVTPVFNGETYVSRLLQSVLEQTYPYVEMILVDDGSGDRTVLVAESYRERFARKRAFMADSRRAEKGSGSYGICSDAGNRNTSDIGQHTVSGRRKAECGFLHPVGRSGDAADSRGSSAACKDLPGRSGDGSGMGPFYLWNFSGLPWILGQCEAVASVGAETGAADGADSAER